MAETQRGTVISGGSWRADKLTAAQRGYGYAWQVARVAFLRKHSLCAECERQGRTVQAVLVDHIVPHRGDMVLFWDRESNWQPLCRDCHDDKTAQERREP